MSDLLKAVRAAPPADATVHAQLPVPTTLAEAGLSLDTTIQLVLKALYFAGELTGSQIGERLGVIYAIVEPAIEFIKAQRYCEIVSGTMIGGASFCYRITSDGRRAAALFLEQNQYVGVAPVPIAQYRAYMDNHRATAAAKLTRDSARTALSELVLSDTVIDEIAPAVNGGHSMFIYGPPGNGKSVIARTIREFFQGFIAIPHAIEVEGSIIRILDPVNHDEQPWVREGGLDRYPSMDRRWAVCRRPLVVAGGELRLESLELSYDARLGFYRAPLQLAANGGMLIIDDFGRQHCEPRDLLNRWMVPLENSVDYLTLKSGVKFEVPFHVFLTFATNIKPSDLVDEAFLRRVRYKVFAENPSPEQFGRIFEMCCRQQGVGYDPALVDHVLRGYYREHAITPRACHPRDLINQALLLAEYRGEARHLTPELLDSACSSYFIEQRN